MIGHNTFSWVDLRAETILGFRMEGNGDSSDYWKTYPNSSADAPSNWDEWTHEENGWVADGCEARFYLSKGSGDSISITYPLDSAYNTGEWYKPTSNGGGGASSMTVSGIQNGEEYIDAYTRAMMIVGNHWDNDTDSEIERIQTIARPLFGNAKWTWISGLSDLPTNCGETTECTYSQWSEWGSCNYIDSAEGQYNDGLQQRFRSVQSGSDCVGELTQTQPCATPTDCEWGAWSEWSSWSGACDFNNNGEPALSRTRTRSVVKPYKGGDYEDLCPAGITENGWSSTQSETETKTCPSSASDCESGEKWSSRVSNGITSGRCVPCGPEDDPNATYSNGCKSGCKSGYKTDIRDNRCKKVGCTDSTAKNYDSTAQTACGDTQSDPTRENECCEYEEIAEETGTETGNEVITTQSNSTVSATTPESKLSATPVIIGITTIAAISAYFMTR